MHDELFAHGKTTEEAVKRLADIVAVLRAPGGCPWDIEQTHESLKRELIEECYEVIQAIENKDDANLREELGDVLLQIVFHSDIARVEKRFDLADVANEECDKMIHRHPHVFGDMPNNITSKQVLENWEDIKKVEHKGESQTESMQKIPKELPALYRADKIQAKAKKVGFDWDDVNGAYQKVAEETAEVKEAVASGNKEEIEKEVGDLLFAAVNVARMLDVDPEIALNKTSDKFMRRFAYVEKTAQEQGKRLPEMTLEEMDKLWEDAKLLGL
jgi:tetrapyrrole methylase family protein/MazG family protein